MWKLSLSKDPMRITNDYQCLPMSLPDIEQALFRVECYQFFTVELVSVKK